MKAGTLLLQQTVALHSSVTRTKLLLWEFSYHRTMQSCDSVNELVWTVG